MKQREHNIKLPVGISDFSKLIKGLYQFADKTLFLKEIMEDGSEVILITRPRRFGKTLNLSMLYHFLQQNDKQDESLFENLEISKDSSFCQTHQNQYPVIFLSFKDVKKSSYQAAYSDMVTLISDLYAQHRYLLDGTLLHEDEKRVFMALLNQ
jgi:hypothetical protein